MFRATLCPSSGENTVPMGHLVLVTLYRWLSGKQGIPLCYVTFILPVLLSQIRAPVISVTNVTRYWQWIMISNKLHVSHGHIKLYKGKRRSQFWKPANFCFKSFKIRITYWLPLWVLGTPCLWRFCYIWLTLENEIFEFLVWNEMTVSLCTTQQCAKRRRAGNGKVGGAERKPSLGLTT
jgi:hypothetical protein